MLRYEALRLGGNDRAKLAHLAGDPERILEIAADYMRSGLYEDALDVLSRQYPSGSAVVSPDNSRIWRHESPFVVKKLCLKVLKPQERLSLD